MLESVGLISPTNQVCLAIVRSNTREHFTQTNFNVFAEVSGVRIAAG